MPAKLCLNMIVRDEEENILECLKNVAHLCDAVAIVDTGSTDKTIKIITKFLEKQNIPGEVISRPWQGFHFSRTEALRFGEDVVFRLVRNNLQEKAKLPKKWKPNFATNMLSLEEFRNLKGKVPTSKDRGSVEYDGTQFLEERLNEYKLSELGDDTWYLMFMDADNRLRVNNWTPNCTDVYKIDKEKMKDDQYGVDMKQGSIVYRYAWMVRVNPEKRWIWKKEIHEHVVPHNWDNPVRGKLLGAYILSGRTGSRNKNPVKYLADAVVCEKWQKLTPDDDHYFFYGAQSYRDAGKPEESIKLYLKRAQMQGWSEQVYISYLEAGKQEQALCEYSFESMKYLFKAFEVSKTRLEAPFFIIETFRRMNLFNCAWEFAKPLINLPKPVDLLFMDEHIHGWMFFDSAAVSAFYSGDYKGAIQCAEKALASGFVEGENVQRIQSVIAASKQKLGQ